MSDKTESVCVHCGVRIMAFMFEPGGDRFWSHVPSEGPMYIDTACRLVAEPARTGSDNA